MIKSFLPGQMQLSCYSSKPERIGFLMLLIFLSAPYIFLRLHGDDYSQGSSVTLVDVFLGIAGIKMMLLIAIKGGRTNHTKLHSVSYPLLLVGYAFMIVSFLSGIEGLLFFGLGDVFSIGRLLSGTSQYAFIMIFLPLFASHYLSANNLKHVMRYISFGYFLPMLLSLFFLPHATDGRLREVFYFANRALGSYGNANTFSGLLVMILPYYVFLSITEKGFWRAMGYVGVSLSLLCLFLTVSFSGMLALIVLIIANILLALFWCGHPIHKYKYRAIHLSISTVFFVTIVFVIATSYMPSIIEDVAVRLFFLDESNTKSIEVENLGSGEARLRLIDVALGLIKSRDGGLLLGHGMRQSEALHEFSFAGPHQDVHLIYLLLWIEGGFILLLLFGAYLLLLIRNVIKLAKIAPFEAVAVGSAVLGLALFGMTYPHMYMRFFWVPLLPAFVNWDAYLRAKLPRPSTTA
ncbi:MAG: hypothetical protein D4R88_01085 [Methanosarcinales archaeon]|nr:MAG: hypothetical protein D4R88_01085 [Methanosarcinales archaeon]